MDAIEKLKAQRDEIDRQLQSALKTERKAAIAKVRELVATFELTEADIFAKKATRKKAVPAKYMNPETGETWSGRGRTPKWLEGKKRERFLIER